MPRLTRQILCGLALVSLGLLSACSSSRSFTQPSSAELDQLTQDVLARSFRSQGQATLDRLAPDEDNRLCAEADRTGVPLSEAQTQAIEARNLGTIRPPSDGRYLGDWREGEKIAQDGRGKTWSDPVELASGGNCYNCHQIGQQELSYGTLGPSLYHYGKLRGVTDPKSESAHAVIEYTWGKIWNARASNACSNMPRFGHRGILTETQIQHLMALLLDPASPVNQ